jgi:hypothetical protein
MTSLAAKGVRFKWLGLVPFLWVNETGKSLSPTGSEFVYIRHYRHSASTGVEASAMTDDGSDDCLTLLSCGSS